MIGVTPGQTVELGELQLSSPSDKLTTASRGFVRGVLTDKTTGQPVSNERVALAIAIVKEGKVTFSALTVDVLNPEKTLSSVLTDEKGAFIIATAPGTYVLESIKGFPSNQVLRASDSSTLLIIRVNAGETVELGEIQLSPRIE